MKSPSPNARRLKSGRRPARLALLAALAACAAWLPLLASAALKRGEAHAVETRAATRSHADGRHDARPGATTRYAASSHVANDAAAQKSAARRALAAQSLNCPNAPTPISYGQTINGALTSQDCPNPFGDGTYYDAYTFTGTAGQQIVVDMTSTDFDTYLYLMRPGETDISPDAGVTVQDDDGGGGTNARVTLTLAASGTYTIIAGAYGNGITQGGTGAYSLTLTNPSSPGVLQLSSAAYSVGEGDGSVTLTVTRTGGSDGAVSVGYATSNGTATAGSDYTAASGTINFSGGQTQQTFSVQITDDQVFESNETFGVALSNPSIALLGSPSSATVTINENDTCGYTLPQPGRTVGPNPSPNSFADSYHTLVGCPAPAVTSNNTSFITAGSVTAPDSSGNGTFAYTVAQNTNSAQRSGTITVADKTFNVTQTGVPCGFSLQSSSKSFGPGADAGSVVVNAAPSDCSWTATSNNDWITINSGASGTGNGSVGFSITANPNSAQRTGTITAAGQTFTVTQLGVTCTFSISPSGGSFNSGGGSGGVAVTAAAPDCQWTASTNDTWITINSGTSGAGSGTVNYTVAANPNSAQRAGSITVAGKTFNVTQTGVTCAFTLSGTQSFGAGAGTGSVGVTAAAQDCQWTATSSTAASNDDWLKITSGASGAGNGSVGFSLAANINSAQRSGTITVGGQTFTVTQSGVTCSFSISPPSQSFAHGGGPNNSVSVTAAAPDCQWTAVSNDNWITINSGASGAGSGGVSYTVAANGGGARTGTITVAGQTFTVNQAFATYNITGHVTDSANNNPLQGVTVTLSVGANATTTTVANGNYSFANIPAGAKYNVTPSLTDYNFNPNSVVIDSLLSDKTADFVGTFGGVTLAGRITDGASPSPSPLSGVTVTLGGYSGGEATTDSQGRYSFFVASGHDYTLTPSLPHYDFKDASNSASISLTDLIASKADADFTGTLRRHNITGRVSGESNKSLTGVTVSLSGTSVIGAITASATTDKGGNYSLAGLPEGGRYTLSVSPTNYAFASTQVDDLKSDQVVNFAPTLNTYAISGHVYDDASPSPKPLSGVDVTLTDSTAATTTTKPTDSQGNFTFSPAAAGHNYTVTVSDTALYHFAQQSLPALSGDQVLTFSGTLRQYTISGRVTKGGNGLDGVTVVLGGAVSTQTMTDASGGYSFTNLPAGKGYTVTPSRANYTFTPPASISSLTSNTTADFAATLNSYTISGRVLAAGSPLAGATVTLGGGATNTQTTDSSGGYSFAVPAEGSYTITVSRRNYTFATPSKDFPNLGSSQAFDFAAAINLYSIAGRVTDSGGFALPGATVNLSGAATASTTTDSAGNYSFANLAAEADYTVTPSKPFYTFAPRSLSFAKLSGDQSGADFTATLNRFTVSGRVTTGAGDALLGVTITMSGGASASATTDARGNYSFAGVPGGASVAVTPAKDNYSFAPARQSINIDGDRPGIDFVASPLPALLRFSQAQYQVNEDAQRVVVTVTRAGNTSTAVGVDVRTLDNPAPVPCGDTTTLPGVAFARCDYATTVETLTFAPGETQKTVSVPVIDDSWVEPSETFQLGLSNPTGGAQLGQQATATVAITDNDAPGEANPIFSTDFFVRQQYLDFLSREPEAGQPWSSVLNNCAPNDPACDRVSVSANFFRSQEFQLKGLFVFKFYKVAFARLPHYAEIVADMRAVTGSTTAELVAKKAAFTDAFAQRQEFKTGFDNLGDAAYVNALLDRYGLQSITTINPASPDDASAPRVTLTRADLVNGLAGGALTRGRVVRAIADSDEVSAAEFNSAFVAMQYFGYLRRDPEAGGYNDWLRTINANPSDVRSMVNGFVNSTEYRLRFGQP